MPAKTPTLSNFILCPIRPSQDTSWSFFTPPACRWVEAEWRVMMRVASAGDEWINKRQYWCNSRIWIKQDMDKWKSYKYISGATNLQESVQAHESCVVPHHLHLPTGDLHHHDLPPGPIPIPLLQYLGRWPEKLLLNINLMILLLQIHYRLISNISLFVPHRQPYPYLIFVTGATGGARVIFFWSV